MITVYGMPSCPDCANVESQIEGDNRFNMVDIGADVKNMKAFMHLRDTSPVFDEAKAGGSIGIPCFVKEDGTITLSPEEVGLSSEPVVGHACRLDGSGC